MAEIEAKSFNLSTIVRPEAEMPGFWTAHVLDLDVVTMGASLVEAIEMATDAAIQVVVSDLKNGRDPLARRAPDEFWREFEEVLRVGTFEIVNPAALAERQELIAVCACQIQMHVIRDRQPCHHGCGCPGVQGTQQAPAPQRPPRG